jgi:F-type H+-transporting ATPase subunit delta
MTTRASAARYARALFDVALQELTPEQAEQDLAQFAALLEEHADLHRALTNPVVPVSAKRGVLDAILAKLTLAMPVQKLLRLLADRDRLVLVPDLLSVYRERLLKHQRVIRAEVTTAEPLAAGQAQRLADRLSDSTGRRVQMSTRVDPALVGGIVARIGGTVYDGSIAGRLARMRRQLVGQM